MIVTLAYPLLKLWKARRANTEGWLVKIHEELAFASRTKRFVKMAILRSRIVGIEEIFFVPGRTVSQDYPAERSIERSLKRI